MGKTSFSIVLDGTEDLEKGLVSNYQLYVRIG